MEGFSGLLNGRALRLLGIFPWNQAQTEGGGGTAKTVKKDAGTSHTAKSEMRVRFLWVDVSHQWNTGKCNTAPRTSTLLTAQQLNFSISDCATSLCATSFCATIKKLYPAAQCLAAQLINYSLSGCTTSGCPVAQQLNYSLSSCVTTNKLLNIQLLNNRMS